MGYDLYWQGPLDAVYQYSEKTRLEYERMRKEMDFKSWLVGRYVRDAVLSVYPWLNPMAGKGAKQIPYPEKPYTVQAEEERQKTEEQKRKEIYAELSAWVSSFKASKVLKGGEKDG